jgi:hypothetical protein
VESLYLAFEVRRWYRNFPCLGALEEAAFRREVISMNALNAIDPSVALESVLCTEELQRRPSRPPDYQTENQALLALVQELTNAPGSVLQRLVDIALELCRAHSAGISLLEEDAPRAV